MSTSTPLRAIRTGAAENPAVPSILGAEPTGYAVVSSQSYNQYETWPANAALGGWAAQTGEAHYQVECSGKGACNRALGVCKCFDGYTGAACQRSA